jgi:hypothetical protein
VFSGAGSARGAGRGRRVARAGAEIRGEVLVTLARLRLATPEQLRALLLNHQEGTDYVRRALRNLTAEKPALAARDRPGAFYPARIPAGGFTGSRRGGGGWRVRSGAHGRRHRADRRRTPAGPGRAGGRRRERRRRSGGTGERPLSELLAVYGKHTLERTLVAAFGITSETGHGEMGLRLAELIADPQARLTFLLAEALRQQAGLAGDDLATARWLCSREVVLAQLL